MVPPCVGLSPLRSVISDASRRQKVNGFEPYLRITAHREVTYWDGVADPGKVSS